MSYSKMNGFNFTYCPVSESYKRITFPLTYGLVFVLGLTLNGTVLWFVCGRTKTWSCSVIYLVNLTVADLFYVLTLPLLIISYGMDDVWPFGNATCKAVHYFFYMNLECSTMFLACMSVHRFLGVRYPVKSMGYRTRRVARFTSALVWLLVATEITPTAVFAHSGFINNMTVCFDMTSPAGFDRYFPYGMFVTTVGFLFPFLVIVTCYCLMVRTLSRADENMQVGKETRSKSIRTVLAVCLLFILCFLPYHIMRVVYLFVRVYMPSNCRFLNQVMFYYKIWRPVVCFNCCVNPLLYFTCSDSHRRQLFAKLRKRRVNPTARSMQVQGTVGKENGPSQELPGYARGSVPQSARGATPQ